MAQQINDTFQLLAGMPIEDRIVKPTITDRDAIPSTRRFQGLQCFVQQTQTLYLLTGGIDNSNWVGIAGSNSASDLETVIEGFYVLSAGKTTLLDWEVGDKFRGWIADRYVVGEILTLPVSLPSDIDDPAKVELAIDSNVLTPDAIPYVTPEQYGAVGDGVADDSIPMQDAIDSGKMVFLGAKTYLLNSTITITNPVTVIGSGNLSVLETTSNQPVIDIQSDLIVLRNFKIEGNGRGTVTNYATTRPLQNGIKIDGAYYNNTVDNVIFESLGNAGIYGANNQNGISTDVTSSININSCFFFNSLFGINFDTLFEYNLVYNSVFKDNETGMVIKGGNNPVIGGHVVNNRTGVSVISGTNDSHSTLSSVTINHNIEHGISVGAIVNGFTFSNCVIFFNDISLVSSNGVSIDGGLFKNNAALVFTSTESTTLQNVKFISTSIPTTFSGNTNMRFFNNSYPLGVSVPSAMKESIVNMTNTDILDINSTTSAGNLLRMRFSGSNRFLLGSDSGITGGADADFNAYVYGNNNFFVSTNGVKRLIVSGAGLSTFSGNVIVPNGTISTHAVNKSQLDLKADLASPALTGTPTAPTAALGTNTIQLATTAFVQAAVTSSAYTPTLTGVSNTSTITHSGKSAYTKVGNIVTFKVAFSVAPTVINTATSFDINLPVARANTGTDTIGSGTVQNTGASNSSCIAQSTTTTTVRVYFYALSISSSQGVINFEYDITQ